MSTFQTTVGDGGVKVVVDYGWDVDDFVINSVTFAGVDILGALTADQVTELVVEACAADAKRHQEHLYDLGADRYEERMAAA